MFTAVTLQFYCNHFLICFAYVPTIFMSTALCLGGHTVQLILGKHLATIGKTFRTNAQWQRLSHLECDVYQEDIGSYCNILNKKRQDCMGAPKILLQWAEWEVDSKSQI